MLSVGPQEFVILGVLILFLIVFGSAKFSRTARDLGQLLGGTKRTVEEAKSDLMPEEVKEARRYKGPQERSASRRRARYTSPQPLAPIVPPHAPLAVCTCSPLEPLE
jgi:Sec-independent protein translocase protein TatA